MKKKITCKKLISGLLSALLALLGFTSCSSADDDPLVLMYAPAPALFGVKGKVVDKDNTDNALSGIQVVAYPVSEGGKKEITELSDTVFTDSKGHFLYKHFEFPNIRLIFEDVNVLEHETSFEKFAKDTVDIDFRDVAREDFVDRFYEITVGLQKVQIEKPGNDEKEAEDEK